MFKIQLLVLKRNGTHVEKVQDCFNMKTLLYLIHGIQ